MIGVLNKLYGKTWNLDNVTYSDGVFTFAPNVLAMAICSMPKPVPNHVYYGSVMQKAPTGSSFPDRRFEWWKSDTAGELIVFAYMEDTNGEWVRQSSVFQASSETSDGWIMRNFTVNGTAESYRKSPIIIDLTAVFGTGNEPTAAWVDANMILSASEDTIFFDVPSALSEISNKRRMMIGGGGFPSEPSAYNLISTYTASQTWTAPEDGYFQVEVFGASGSGGAAYAYYDDYSYDGNSGGGGGGGGYACSNIKLKKGDTISIIAGAIGSVSSVTIASSLESYSKITVTSGANGTKATARNSGYHGKGGAGGTASGGNIANANGSAGGDGRHANGSVNKFNAAGGTGGAAGYTGGNAGGVGGSMYGSSGATSPGTGSAGFIRIYRGNTN